MNKLMMSAAAIAACLSASSAGLAQDNDKTTIVTVSPSGRTTETSVTTTSDGYKKFTRTVTATKHYDAGVYVGPSGYAYARYTVGERAPAMFRGGHGTLENYSTYGLDSPPVGMGLNWVRVGNDALLIDSSTGEVVQADYGLFGS